MLLDNMSDKNKILLFDKIQKLSVLPFNIYMLEKYLMEYNVIKARHFINLLYGVGVHKYYYCYN